MGKAVIENIVRRMEIDEKRRLRRFYVIRFSTEKGQIGEVRIPEEEFSEERVLKEVAEKAKQLDALAGREVEYEEEE